MIEATVRNHLKTAIENPVYIDVPADPPASYVSIERTGGREDEHIRNAMIAIQSFGGGRYNAAALHESVIEQMKTLNTLDNVSACNLSAEYDFTDRETKRYRYQAVFDIIYY